MYTSNGWYTLENDATNRCTPGETVPTERLFSALRWATASSSMLIAISNA